MKFAAFCKDGRKGLAVEIEGGFHGLTEDEAGYPGDLLTLIRKGGDAFAEARAALQAGAQIPLDSVALLPPISDPEKIICVGLNYRDHSAESGFEQPAFPTLFGRFNSSLIGHGAPIVRPLISDQLDYEGELVAVIGREARNVPEAEALDYVAGYSIFNDASIRDYQFKSPQWTAGKNFDDSGAFGPWFVTADALPAGCLGLTLTTRLNGQVVQQASIDDMVFSVAQLVAICSEFMTLKPGDVIVTGTPSGVGLARKPPLFMRDGDTCEVEIDGIGLLSNPIRDEQAQPLAKSA
ncbi:fumarylacetoacetate hydrolase family protein [Paracoccus versutus]|uniref:fumarylacetoacetate hydrolase family protein n=1 Tax=Paracoccus versutus TaxID=34007 RepID=UPI000DF865F8|nr:fumarylacetoacetate hydrolase family protein [Paracoccus versutus]RDD69810.1 FAA hydrolase family protein [Paracoccus versutus]